MEQSSKERDHARRGLQQQVLRPGAPNPRPPRLCFILAVALVAAAGCWANPSPSPSGPCTRVPMRPDAAVELARGDAVIVLERNGGFSCVDDLYAVYPDGGIVSDFGNGRTRTSQISSDKVSSILVQVVEMGWFTDNVYSTSHVPCPACFEYSMTVKYKGQTKTVGFVDGDSDGPLPPLLKTELPALLYPDNPA